MRWYKTKNKWLNGVFSKAMCIHSELDSCACMSSPLTKAEVDKIERAMRMLQEVNEAVYNRGR